MEEEKASSPEPVAEAQPSPEKQPAQATSAIASFLTPQKEDAAVESDGDQEDGAQPADHSEEQKVPSPPDSDKDSKPASDEKPK